MSLRLYSQEAEIPHLFRLNYQEITKISALAIGPPTAFGREGKGCFPPTLPGPSLVDVVVQV